MLYGELNTVTIGEQTVRGFKFQRGTPPKVAVLRLPTSAEMIDRINSQKSVRKNLGRGQVRTDAVPNDAADLTLFAKLKVAGDDFDVYEARTAISQLTSADVIAATERDGDGYRITLTTPFGELVHWMKIPSDRALFFYRKSVFAVTELPRNMEELRYRAESGVELYDACKDRVTGYADGIEVPAHHKFAVASELSQACSLDGEFDPNS